MNARQFLASGRRGSSETNVVEMGENFKARGEIVVQQIRDVIDATVKSIESDIFNLNRDRIIIAMANWLASNLQFDF